jgi:NADH-quinone oxidoreductase subunit M
MASIGLPGFSGFVAELQVLIGAWHAFPFFAIAAGVGIVIGIAYTWRAMQKAFFETTGQKVPERVPAFPPITLPERAGALILAGVSLVIGLYPQLLLRIIGPALRSPMFDGLWKGSGR